MATLKYEETQLILNCNILKTRTRKNSKFGENAFRAYPNILVRSEKLYLNAILSLSLRVVARQGKQYGTMNLISYLNHYCNELP